MFLIGHGAVGALLATRLTENPVAAFGIGWLSHYLVDFFPHGDESLGAWAKKKHEILRLFFLFAIDGALLLSTLFWIFYRQGFSWVILAGAAGSIVPDVMWGLEKLFHKKIFGRADVFHNRNHNFFHISMPLWVGLVGQAIVTVAVWGMV